MPGEVSLDGEDSEVEHLTTLNHYICNCERKWVFFTDLDLVKNFPGWHIC